MPPKKKSKATGGDAAAAVAAAVPVADESTTAAAAAASASPPAAAASAASPLQLAAGGVDSLRLLARYRPHRVGMAGIGMAAAAGGAAMPPPPPPAPVTLQIVDVRRYFVDHRFWALVGVPLPTLPVAPSSLPMGAPQPSAADGNGNGNGMEELMGARMGAGAATAASAAAGAAPSSFDEQSDLHVAYDVLLSDGRLQVKALLSPTLAIHAEKGGLLPTGVIRVREAALRFDETIVADPGFIVLRQIDIVADRTDQIVIAEEGGALSYPAWVDAAAQSSKPLIGGPRSYYLSLFNDDTVYFDRSNYPEQSEAERVAMDQAALRAPVVPLDGEEESKEDFAAAGAGARAAGAGGRAGPGSALSVRARAAPRALPLSMQDSVLLDAEVLYPGDTISIRRLLREGPGFQPGDLHIVGRIFAKSRIFNFGRKSVSRSDLLRSPFNFELLLGDSSGEQIKVVLWNTLVGAYFHRLHVGQVVAVRGFRLKQARADQQFELALNPYNPIGSVRVFSDSDAAGLAPSIWERVPPIVMTVSTVAQVATMPDESVFDLAGVVTFAGPMRREFAPAKKQFFQYRWLLVVDPSCTDAVPVKLFTNSHQEDVESISVSDVLYLSNLTCRSSVSVGANDLLQVASLPSQQAGRSIVATSTNYTQMLGPEAMERSGHPYLLQLIQWGHQADHGLLQSHPSLWRWSLDFSLYRSMYSEAVTPLRDCLHVLQGLRFQQMRGVLVQAFVAEVVVHPAGMRAVQDGRMDQVQYDAALRHLALTAPEAEGDEGQDAAAAAAEKPAAAAAPRGKKGRARFAPSAEGEASAAEISASQSSTVSSRLRRSARSQTVGDTRAAETAAASSRAASETRSGRSRTRGTVQQGAEGEEEEAGRHRASSADIGTPVKRRGKLVKIVQRRLKRKERPEGEEETAAAAAAAASVAAPSPAVAVAAVSSSPSFFAGIGSGSSVNGSSPSSPSTLCTLLLRDLNGEFDLCVQLQDPVLGHVSFDRAVGSIHAAGYETPPAAPRIFDGLSRVLPASAFTREEWRTLIEQASGVEIEEEVAAAPAAAAGAAGPSRGRGKKAAAAAAAAAARPRDEFSIRRAAIAQLHQALLAALSPLRLLASAMLVRESYTHTHANLTAVFSAL